VTATAVTPGNAGDAQVATELLSDVLATPGTTPTVYGDSAYGAGEVLAALDAAGAVSRVKVQPANGVPGHFTKDDFTIDLDAGTVTCPAGRTARLTRARRGDLNARFRAACAACPLVARCTTSSAGRTITVGPYEALLTAGRAATRDPAWQDDHRPTRPKVERKLAHLVRRTHGGRRARVRGRQKVGADFSLLAAAVNLARLARLGITRSGGIWAVRPA
jgi:hypothetical protein